MSSVVLLTQHLGCEGIKLRAQQEGAGSCKRVGAAGLSAAGFASSFPEEISALSHQACRASAPCCHEMPAHQVEGHGDRQHQDVAEAGWLQEAT
jgi:hypothetical protein